MEDIDIKIAIIGAGVIGCSVAHELSQNFSGDIAVIEKNSKVTGENQSSRNSGVIHAGVYYPKDFGPLKASLCVEGSRLLYEFCEKHNIAHKKTGKLIVAVNRMQEEYLEDVLRIAGENKVSQVKKIDKNDIKKYEPNVNGVAAVFIPDTGIIEPTNLVEKIKNLAEQRGVIFLADNKAVSIKPLDDGKGFLVKIASKNSEETFKTKILINCAGLYSDEVAKMINPESLYEIEPVKGEAAKFYSSKRENLEMNKMNVYPVPLGYYLNGERADVSFSEFNSLFKKHKLTKSVGAHLTPTFEFEKGGYKISDTVTIGPVYSKPENREDYTHTRDENYYRDAVKPFFPGIETEDISLNQTGIRAKLKNYYDFVIERDKKYFNALNLIGIDSPGLSSCLAIAKYVKELLKDSV